MILCVFAFLIMGYCEGWSGKALYFSARSIDHFSVMKRLQMHITLYIFKPISMSSSVRVFKMGATL